MSRAYIPVKWASEKYACGILCFVALQPWEGCEPMGEEKGNGCCCGRERLLMTRRRVTARGTQGTQHHCAEIAHDQRQQGMVTG
jgi:hypothetical protein